MDRRRRELEQRARAGDVGAQVRVEALRLRSGELPVPLPPLVGLDLETLGDWPLPSHTWVQVDSSLRPAEGDGVTLASLAPMPYLAGRVMVRIINRAEQGGGHYPYESWEVAIPVRELTLSHQPTRDLLQAAWPDPTVGPESFTVQQFQNADLLERAGIMAAAIRLEGIMDPGPDGWSSDVLPVTPELILWRVTPAGQDSVKRIRRGWAGANYAPYRPIRHEQLGEWLVRFRQVHAPSYYDRRFVDNPLFDPLPSSGPLWQAAYAWIQWFYADFYFAFDQMFEGFGDVPVGYPWSPLEVELEFDDEEEDPGSGYPDPGPAMGPDFWL